MNPDTQSEVEAGPHDGRELAHVVQDRCGEIETGFAGCRFGKKGPGRKVEGAARPIEREKSVRACLAIERDSACPHFAGRAVREQDVVVETIVAQGVDQLACGRLGERDDFRIGRQHAKPVSGARDAIVQFPMHQADDPRRHVAERGEAPLAGQPFVVRQDHERRHERHEDQRGQPSSHRRQERGDPVDYASHPLPHGTPSIRIAEAHGLPFRAPDGLWSPARLRSTSLQRPISCCSRGRGTKPKIRREARHGLNAGDGTTGSRCPRRRARHGCSSR